MTEQRNLVYRITFRSPALFPLGTGDPNAPDTAFHVPGSALRGALANHWLSAHPEVQDAADHPEFRRLFLDGSTCFLNGYPATLDGDRMLPAPHSLFHAKRDGIEGGVVDAAAYPDKPPGSEFVSAQAELGFVRWSSGTLSIGRPAMIEDMHQVRDREKGRPGDGDIFSYPAVTSGESFIAAIVTQSREDEETLRGLLVERPLRLGRSRHARYGARAEVEILDRPGWSEVRGAWSDSPPEELVVTLLSDYIGRSPESGQIQPGAFVEELRTALGCDELEPLRTYASHRVVHGYHGHGRVGRSSVPALAAGSVFVFSRPDTIEEPEDPDDVRVLHLGERRGEGFGRVALDWHGSSETGDPEERVRPINALTRGIALATEEDESFREVRNRMLTQWLDEQIPRVAHDLTLKDGHRSWPSPTVIAALRNAVVRMEEPPGGGRSMSMKKAIGSKACDQLRSTWVFIPSARQAPTPLFDLIEGLRGNGAPRQVMALLSGQEPPKLFEGVIPEEAAMARLALRLADALLERARRLAVKSGGEVSS